MTAHPCPQCGDSASFSKKRNCHFCAECELEFNAQAEDSSKKGEANAVGPGRADKPLKLFLSYGRDDHVQEVKALRDALRDRGHEVWYDEEQLGTGLDWEDRIEKGLQWCDRVVLTMTPHSVRRPDGYCLNELAKALELRKAIIPVLLVEVPQGAPTSICRIQYLDWRDAVPAAEKVERFMLRLSRLCEAIEEDKLDFEGGQQRLIRHLQPINFDGDLQRHVASFKGRVQLEERLRAWLRDPRGSQVLWLTAAPGLGKSAVAAVLSHRWAEVAAVHFCVAGHQDKTNPARAVLSIAYQLSQRQHMSVYANRLSKLELEREAHKDARTLFDTLLVAPLARDFPQPPQPLVVILDGLDEATQPGGDNPLAEVVAADWGRLPPWLRLMVSSRAETELVPWLAGTQRIEIRSGDEEQKTDLLAFLLERLTAIGRPPSDEALARILERSEGAFHYAVLLVEEVRQGRCDPENPVDLPGGLNPFYLQTFRRRFTDLTTYRSQVRPLLELLLAAPEPVPLAVLAGATRREVRDVRQDLTQLGSMLSIEPGQDETDHDWDTARVSHASMRAWLTGLDATRQPMAGLYAAQPDTKGLAVEVLGLWEKANDPNKATQDPAPERRGFVVRTLWLLLKTARDEVAMGRVAFDLSLYWEDRRLSWAIEPGEFAGQAAWKTCEAGTTETAVLRRGANCLGHLGDLQLALGHSQKALEAYRKSLSLNERLSAEEPDKGKWQSHLGASHIRVGEVLEAQGNLAGALVEFRKSMAIRERLVAQDPDNTAWQRDLSFSHNRVGGVLETQGNLAGALAEFNKDLAIAKRLATEDPNHNVWQSDLSATHNRVGGVLESQGNLTRALAEFRKAMLIRERLVAQDPDNVSWQRDMGFSHDRVGDILESQGNLTGALTEFRKAMAIRERLVAQDPDNAGWQRDLSFSHNRVGGVLEAQGKFAGALAEFNKDLTIAERLALQDPDNARWQNDLSASHNRVGGVLEAQGNLNGALTEFRKSMAIRERLVAQDPDNAGWQRDLSFSYNRVGGVLETQGKLAGALAEFNKDLAIAERLALQDPDNAVWQSDLSGSHNRVGDVLEAQGNLAGALAEFRKSMAIRERLALQDPDNAGWQRDLSFSHNRVGGVLEVQGNLTGALAEYNKDLTIAGRLATQAPDNAEWQRDLSLSHSRIGDVLEAQGDLTGALTEFRKSMETRERLLAQDPDNTRWQRDLSFSHNRVGGVLEAQGKLAAALVEFNKDLAIAERLALQDPDNAMWQSDLSGSHNRIGDVLEAQGNLTGALDEFRKSMAIRERLALQDPDNAGWQRDLSFSHNRVGGALEAQGDLAAALTEFNKDLAIAERLALQDPDNARWQSDLSGSHKRVGGVLEAQGDLAGALAEFRKSMAIRERLVAQNPDNPGWQRDLAYCLYRTGGVHEERGEFSVAAELWLRELEVREALSTREEDPSEVASSLAACHHQIGGVLAAVGDHEGALAAFETYLALRARILEANPADKTARRNVAIGQVNIARNRVALLDFASADARIRPAAETLRDLLDPEDPGTRIDYAAVIALRADIAERTGDQNAQIQHQAELLDIDLHPEGIQGLFRKRFLPLILQRLAQSLVNTNLDRRAQIVFRALQLSQTSPSNDVSIWIRHARDVFDLLPPGHAMADKLRPYKE